MSRKDYWHEVNAPQANSLVPAASAIVSDQNGKILLQRRKDNNLWALPGGAMEVGETLGETAIRETREETGLDVVPEYIVGIYTDPQHIIAFSDGEIRQEFSLCFACRLVSGTLSVSDESLDVRFFAPEEIGHLDMHPSIRRRLSHFLAKREHPFIG